MAKDNKKDKENESKEEAQASLFRQDPPPTLYEWIIRGISFALVLGLLGYFTFKAFQPTVEPKFAFEVMRDQIAERNGSWVVPVGVKNEGTRSVHELRITGSMTFADGTEKENASIPLLGAGEVAVAEFWFDHNPEGNEMRFDLGTYLVP